MTIVADLGADSAVMIFELPPPDCYDPLLAICDAMLSCDVGAALATTGNAPQPRRVVVDAGRHPAICVDGRMTLEMFQMGAATANYVEAARLKRCVRARVFGKDAKSVHVTSLAGTDLTYSVEGLNQPSRLTAISRLRMVVSPSRWTSGA